MTRALRFSAGDRVRVISTPDADVELIGATGTVYGPAILFDYMVKMDVPYTDGNFSTDELVFIDDELEFENADV